MADFQAPRYPPPWELELWALGGPCIRRQPRFREGTSRARALRPRLPRRGARFRRAMLPLQRKEAESRLVRPTSFAPELVPNLRSSSSLLDPHAVKRDFPILREPIHGSRLVWLDNAATTQKPQAVIDRLSYFYEHENSNIHRAAHTLAARATDAYEVARERVRRFINAPSARDIVFVRGATEGINLVAQSWGRRNVGPGDEIVITWLEHHANIVPWQQLAAEKGAQAARRAGRRRRSGHPRGVREAARPEDPDRRRSRRSRMRSGTIDAGRRR